MKIKKFSGILLMVFSVVLAAAPAAFAEEDVEGSKDPSFLTRMPNFRISEYEEKDFEAYEFEMGERSTRVEGRKYNVFYMLQEGAKNPSELQIKRNYINAVRKIGGSAVYEDKDSRRAVLKIAKDGKEAWVEVVPSDEGASYRLIVIEKQAMAQDVSANDMFEALNRDGHIALYINFDTAKSTIKPESQKVIDQVAEMMQNNAELNISVEGHTDTVGDRSKNKVLSEERAKSVVAALVKQGIDAKRLSAAGFGQDKPIADNKTEEGRAKNRRVELVKK